MGICQVSIYICIHLVQVERILAEIDPGNPKRHYQSGGLALSLLREKSLKPLEKKTVHTNLDLFF